jgi:GDP-4-dehydro-6-deoxy-D-mannose reductase
MRVLITGCSGFVGGHLCEQLLATGEHTIIGTGRTAQWPRSTAHLADRVALHGLELHDTKAWVHLLNTIEPEWIFHLAGYANTGKSFREPEQCWQDNLTGCQRFYDAVLASRCRPRIVFASSGLIYGDPDAGEETLHERTTLKPASPYAASKAAADLLGYQLARSAGLHIVRVRLFNQIGPRQTADYAVPNFARQIAAIEAGQQVATLQTGDLSAYRDLTDVRDMARAMIALAEHGTAGEAYNAGSGVVWQISDVLAKLVAHARVPITVQSQVDAQRLTDTKVNRCDPAKLKGTTGWQPQFSLEETLGDVLAEWRGHTAG